jgi:hypothetical protein
MDNNRDNKCIVCGKDSCKYRFSFLEVQTLHIRDLRRESRVQALGEFGEGCLCGDCAEKRLAEIRNPGPKMLKKLLPFAAVFALGGVLSVLFWGKDRTFFAVGLAAMACGIMGTYSRIRNTRDKHREYSSLSDGEAAYEAAWEAFSEALPAKDGDNDMSYIPINDRTLAMKNGDLMIAYDLLPDIARKAWKILHGKDKTAEK